MDMKSYMNDFKSGYSCNSNYSRAKWRIAFTVGGLSCLLIGIAAQLIHPWAGIPMTAGGIGIIAYAIVYFRREK